MPGLVDAFASSSHVVMISRFVFAHVGQRYEPDLAAMDTRVVWFMSSPPSWPIASVAMKLRRLRFHVSNTLAISYQITTQSHASKRGVNRGVGLIHSRNESCAHTPRRLPCFLMMAADAKTNLTVDFETTTWREKSKAWWTQRVEWRQYYPAVVYAPGVGRLWGPPNSKVPVKEV
jgi:hypothetical protein